MAEATIYSRFVLFGITEFWFHRLHFQPASECWTQLYQASSEYSVISSVSISNCLWLFYSLFRNSRQAFAFLGTPKPRVPTPIGIKIPAYPSSYGQVLLSKCAAGQTQPLSTYQHFVVGSLDSPEHLSSSLSGFASLTSQKSITSSAWLSFTFSKASKWYLRSSGVAVYLETRLQRSRIPYSPRMREILNYIEWVWGPFLASTPQEV